MKKISLWLLYQSYCNPILMVCLAGFICHPLFLWFVAFLVAYILLLDILSFADAKCSVKHLTEAYNDIFDQGNYLIRPVQIDDSISNLVEEISSIRIYSQLRNFIKENPYYSNLLKEPVRIFIAEGQDGKIFREPKAYTNFLGPSLIFLHRPLEQMDLLDRFLLLHELEHVTLNGAMQLSRMHSRPLFVSLNVIILCFFATSWWHWLIITAYAILNWNSHFDAVGKREIIADNVALLRFSNTEKEEIVKDLIELSGSYLQEMTGLQIYSWMERHFHSLGEEYKARFKEIVNLVNLKNQKKLTYPVAIWIDRLIHFRMYESQLKKGNPLPNLGWESFWDKIASIPFGLFFLYLGMNTAFPPIFPFVFVLTFIFLDVFWFYPKYINQFLEISSNIESRVKGINAKDH